MNIPFGKWRRKSALPLKEAAFALLPYPSASAALTYNRLPQPVPLSGPLETGRASQPHQANRSGGISEGEVGLDRHRPVSSVYVTGAGKAGSISLKSHYMDEGD